MYGCDSSIPSPIFKLSSRLHCFRLIVLEDEGIRTKQTLFDSAVGIKSSANSQPILAHQNINKSFYHSLNELSTYMFGYYGILMSESYGITKIDYLPGLPSMPHSILVTRLFSLDPTFQATRMSSRTSDDWHGVPCVDSCGIPLHPSVSTRFSIGLVIPVGDNFRSIEVELADNWHEISLCLGGIQKAVTEELCKIYRLRKGLRAQPVASPPTSSSPHTFTSKSQASQMLKSTLSFPNFSLQANPTVNQVFLSFVLKLQHLVDVPRLFIPLQESNQQLIQWASTVASWLELKDGRYSNIEVSPPSDPSEGMGKPGLQFLANLLAIIMPARLSILQQDDTNKNKTVRVVILTGNPIVSEKLIFLLAGLLGYDRYAIKDIKEAVKLNHQDSKSHSPELATTSPHSSSDGHSSDEGCHPSIPPPHRRNISFSASKSHPISIRPPETIKPVDSVDRSEGSTPLSSSSGSSSLTARGWVPPTKAYSIVSDSPSVQGLSNVTAQRISIPRLRRESSYASLQNLSTSYGTQHATSSSSWRSSFYLGSFMDHWKFGGASGKGSGKSSVFSSPDSPVRREFTPAIDRTPSPAAEYTEYPWKQSGSGMTPVHRSFSRDSATFSPSFAPPSCKMRFGAYSAEAGSSHTSAFNRVFAHYSTKQKFCMSRNATRLTAMYERQISAVDSVVDEILNKEALDLKWNSVENHPEVLDVGPLPAPNCLMCPEAYRLPPLIGYTEKFQSEFSLLSCAQFAGVESTILEAMSGDVRRMGSESESVTYIVNLRRREVKLVRVEGRRNYQEKDGYQPKVTQSRLTSSLRGIHRPKTEMLFSPFMQQRNLDKLTYAPSETLVDRYDGLLNAISGTITRFFKTQMKKEEVGEDDGRIDEDRCCKKIRQLIVELRK